MEENKNDEEEFSSSVYMGMNIIGNILNEIDEHILMSECIRKAPLNAICEVLKTLEISVSLGHFLDDYNRKINDNIERKEPDEPVCPTIDAFCKDKVKVVEETIFIADENEGK